MRSRKNSKSDDKKAEKWDGRCHVTEDIHKKTDYRQKTMIDSMVENIDTYDVHRLKRNGKASLPNHVSSVAVLCILLRTWHRVSKFFFPRGILSSYKSLTTSLDSSFNYPLFNPLCNIYNCFFWRLFITYCQPLLAH